MFVLKGLLWAETQEMILIYLLLRRRGYGRSIAEFHQVPSNPIQKRLARLEADGVVVSQLVGNVRNYELNPRYPFLEPLTALLQAAAKAYPQDLVGSVNDSTNPSSPGRKAFNRGRVQ